MKWIILPLFFGLGVLFFCNYYFTDAVAEETQQSQSSVSATKESVEKKLQESVNAIDKQISELRAKSEKAQSQTKKEIEENIEYLEGQRKILAQKMSELQKASGQAWEDLKNGIKKSIDEIQKAANKAKNRF